MLAELTQESVRIRGRRGELAGELAYPESRVRCAALLVNPHPHMGGRVENYLIACLARELAGRGMVTLRFDYSGVGASEGSRVDVAQSMQRFWETGYAPEDPNFVEDVRAVGAWMNQNLRLPLVVIGYSFGAYAAVQADLDNPAAFVFISPTVKQHDFSRAHKHPVPKLVIYSDDDFATPMQMVERWVESLPQPRESLCMPGGNHFYRLQERRLVEVCAEFLLSAVSLVEVERS